MSGQESSQVAVKVRRIRAHEGSRLRAIRLRALADAPTAFASSLAEELPYPQAHWEEFARKTAAAPAHTTFIAEEDKHWYGMAGGFVDRAHPDIVWLVAMWVDPTRRRSGIGAALVGAVVQWACGCDAKQVQLWVTETNPQAKSLYAQQGFVETDETKPLPSNPALGEVLMVRKLT